MKMHNMSKILLANNKFRLWKSLIYSERADQNAISQFLLF